MNVLSKNPLVQRIASGKPPAELLQFLLAKQLPLTEEEYLEACVAVSISVPEQAEAAAAIYGRVGDSVKETYIKKKEAVLEVVQYVLEDALKRAAIPILQGIVQNADLPPAIACRAAEAAPAGVLEMMVENQIRLIGFPEIMEAMERNPQCNGFVRGKIHEIREFYLKPSAAEPIPDDQAMAAMEELTQVVQEDGSTDTMAIRQRALSDIERINKMSTTDRIKLALTGTRTDRMILIHDANKMVSQSVVESPKLGEDEVKQIAANRSLGSDLIAKIASNRNWTRNYPIMLELVMNPKTPVSQALGFVKQLQINHLRSISMDKNVSPVVRQFAQQSLRTKSGGH